MSFTPTLMIPNSMLIMALMSLMLSRKKILMALMSLELILLNLFFSFYMSMSIMGLPVFSSIYIMALGACEASLGLSLIINMTRFKGNDMLTKNTMKC